MNLTEFSKEVHKVAVEHGWWDEPPGFPEVIALCHSELSEALEEYRKPIDRIASLPIYYSGGGYVADAPTACAKKPAGIAIELADCILRILDYCGAMDIDIGLLVVPLNDWAKWDKRTETFLCFISYLHYELSVAYEEELNKVNSYKIFLAVTIGLIFKYCKEYNIDIEQAMKIKHEYNKTRPYKHGGKKI